MLNIQYHLVFLILSRFVLKLSYVNFFQDKYLTRSSLIKIAVYKHKVMRNVYHTNNFSSFKTPFCEQWYLHTVRLVIESQYSTPFHVKRTDVLIYLYYSETVVSRIISIIAIFFGKWRYEKINKLRVVIN